MKEVVEFLLKELYPDKNALIADLQDYYAKMSFEELAKISTKEWRIIDKIFPLETRLLMKKQVIKVLKEQLSDEENQKIG